MHEDLTQPANSLRLPSPGEPERARASADDGRRTTDDAGGEHDPRPRSHASPTPDAFARARAVLRRVWGHDDFREPQRAPLAAALAGRDVLAILPTGGGKSMLYQIPALVDGDEDGGRSSSLTLVVSPLVALMHDQVAALREKGVRAAMLDASLSRRQSEDTYLRAQHGAIRLLYIAPERVESEMFDAYLDRLPVTRLAIDEAHCVSAWGRHFRPAYLRLPDLRARIEAARGAPVPLTAVTASAPPDVRRDLLTLLGLRDPAVFVGGVDRPNLTYEVREATRAAAARRGRAARAGGWRRCRKGNRLCGDAPVGRRDRRTFARRRGTRRWPTTGG